MKTLIALCLVAGPALADTCPAATDHTVRQSEIYSDLQALPTPQGAQELSNQLWALWTDAPDAAAQALLDEGMRQRSGFNLLGARDTLDQLVEYCPEYAEGYNQRAFANFLNANYDAALFDLDVTLQINPGHTGALTGKALTLLRLGRDAEAQVLLREAVALNPWLAERNLIAAPKGEDI